jgi:Lar family restriction alleviation protein
MEELKPCPFCGGKARYNSRQMPQGYIVVGYDCEQCGAAATVYTGPMAVEKELKIQAANAWNRRPAPDNSRLENCHIYEPGEDVETIADNCEVLIKGADLQKLTAVPENKPQQLCDEDENFIQTKFGYCFYTLEYCPLIYNLYVHPQYRHQGHSRTLLELVIAKIRKNGYEGKIRIQAKPRENSIGLADLTKYYKSLGLIICNAHKLEGSEKP